MSERILIFGGSGFIGGRLAEIAREDGHLVSIYDRRLYHDDVLDRQNVFRVVEKIQPTIAYYLITPSFSEAKGDSPLHLQAGVDGAINVGEACRHYGVHKIVWASSAMVYNSEEQDKNEGHSIVRPQNLYGLSKVLMEDIARYIGNSTIVRFFNVYGPTQTDARILSHIITTVRDQIAEGRSPEVHLGSLSSQRDFVYVDDVVRAILSLAERPYCDTVNIGTGVGMSIDGLIAKIEQIIHQEIKVVVDLERIRPDEWPRLVADTTRLKSLLPAVSFRSLDDGLEEML